MRVPTTPVSATSLPARASATLVDMPPRLPEPGVHSIGVRWDSTDNPARRDRALGITLSSDERIPSDLDRVRALQALDVEIGDATVNDLLQGNASGTTVRLIGTVEQQLDALERISQPGQVSGELGRRLVRFNVVRRPTGVDQLAREFHVTMPESELPTGIADVLAAARDVEHQIRLSVATRAAEAARRQREQSPPTPIKPRSLIL